MSHDIILQGQILGENKVVYQPVKQESDIKAYSVTKKEETICPLPLKRQS